MGSIKRKECPGLVARNQEIALASTIYILRTIGPLGFCLKEEGDSKDYKVFIGSPHTCTCNAFVKERDLCRHICWVILKRLKISKENPISFQLGLIDRDIEGILAESKKVEVKPLPNQKQSSVLDCLEGCKTLRKPLEPDDVCPICQENFLEKHWPITYCRNGCGNNVHIRCMKIWSDHQIKDFGTAGCDTVKCPYCRGEFCSISQLKREYRNDPTRLIKYKKEVCGLEEKKNELGINEGDDTSESSKAESSETGDEKLRQKKRQRALKVIETVPSHIVPPDSRLVDEGCQCCICLKPFQARELVGRLACRHRFHKNCLINWFTDNQPVCPIDQTPVAMKTEDKKPANPTKKPKSNEKKDEMNFMLCGKNMTNDTSIDDATPKPSVLSRHISRRNKGVRLLKNNSDLFNKQKTPLTEKVYKLNVAKNSKFDSKSCKNLPQEFTLVGNKFH